MSNKLKRESKKAQKQQEEVNKQDQEQLMKQAFEIHHAKYLPEAEIVFTGVEFMMLMDALEDTIRNFTYSTYDDSGKRNGFSLPNSMGKLSEYLGDMQSKHRENFENGIAIPHQEYVNEMSQRAALARKNQEEVEAKKVEPVKDEVASEQESKVIELSSTKP